MKDKNDFCPFAIKTKKMFFEIDVEMKNENE